MFPFYLIYTRLEAEEADNPETPTGADKINKQKPTKTTLSAKGQGKKQHNKTENFWTITTPLQPNTVRGKN